jgi:hypothetical protein
MKEDSTGCLAFTDKVVLLTIQERMAIETRLQEGFRQRPAKSRVIVY